MWQHFKLHCFTWALPINHHASIDILWCQLILSSYLFFYKKAENIKSSFLIFTIFECLNVGLGYNLQNRFFQDLIWKAWYISLWQSSTWMILKKKMILIVILTDDTYEPLLFTGSTLSTSHALCVHAGGKSWAREMSTGEKTGYCWSQVPAQMEKGGKRGSRAQVDKLPQIRRGVHHYI